MDDPLCPFKRRSNVSANKQQPSDASISMTLRARATCSILRFALPEINASYFTLQWNKSVQFYLSKSPRDPQTICCNSCYILQNDKVICHDLCNHFLVVNCPEVLYYHKCCIRAKIQEMDVKTPRTITTACRKYKDKSPVKVHMLKSTGWEDVEESRYHVFQQGIKDEMSRILYQYWLCILSYALGKSKMAKGEMLRCWVQIRSEVWHEYAREDELINQEELQQRAEQRWWNVLFPKNKIDDALLEQMQWGTEDSHWNRFVHKMAKPTESSKISMWENAMISFVKRPVSIEVILRSWDQSVVKARQRCEADNETIAECYWLIDMHPLEQETYKSHLVKFLDIIGLTARPEELPAAQDSKASKAESTKSDAPKRLRWNKVLAVYSDPPPVWPVEDSTGSDESESHEQPQGKEGFTEYITLPPVSTNGGATQSPETSEIGSQPVSER